jgi:hypothetical protein
LIRVERLDRNQFANSAAVYWFNNCLSRFLINENTKAQTHELLEIASVSSSALARFRASPDIIWGAPRSPSYTLSEAIHKASPNPLRRRACLAWFLKLQTMAADGLIIRDFR